MMTDATSYPPAQARQKVPPPREMMPRSDTLLAYALLTFLASLLFGTVYNLASGKPVEGFWLAGIGLVVIRFIAVPVMTRVAVRLEVWSYVQDQVDDMAKLERLCRMPNHQKESLRDALMSSGIDIEPLQLLMTLRNKMVAEATDACKSANPRTVGAHRAARLAVDRHYALQQTLGEMRQRMVGMGQINLWPLVGAT